MATRRANVVTVLLHIAEDLEDRGYGMAGVIRQLAREVATMPDAETEGPGRCGCGRVVVQPRTGRPRKFCLVCSPQRKTNGKRQDDRDSQFNRIEGAA